MIKTKQNREGGICKGTPEQVLKSIVEGINTGNLDALMPLYEPEAAFAAQPGSLTHGLAGVREGLAGFIAMKSKLRFISSRNRLCLRVQGIGKLSP